MSTRRIMYVIAIAIVILLVGYYGLNTYLGLGSNTLGGSGGQTSGNTVKEFTIQGFAYGYSPSTIEVNKGDLVKITFVSDDILHNLSIEGYNIATDSVSKGQSSTIQFTANMAGTFAFYCSIPGHSDAGMVGKLIVDG
jgi:plastocyanin